MAVVKDKKDVSVLLETQVPEFIADQHPKFKKFIEKYYEFMESHQLYFGSTFTFHEGKLQAEDQSGENYLSYEDGDRIQLDSERDTAGNANLMFDVGETLTGNTSGATAVVTGTKGNTIAFVKSSSEADFTYGEKVTGSASRAHGTLANGIVDGTFPEGSVESYRSRAPAAAIRELSDSQDIDKATVGLIDDAWKKEFYTNIPKTTLTDRRQLLKRMIQVYRSKGNESSYGWLFRSIFAKEDIEFYYPKTDMLKLSDGNWALDKSIKILTAGANNITLFTGRRITGALSKCTAMVEKQQTTFAGALEVTELTLSDVVQGVVDDVLFFFKPNETITSETDTDGFYAEAITTGILQSVAVDVGGTNYIIGDEVHVTGGGGQGARARVASILDSVVEGINVIDSGDGYAPGDLIEFINEGSGGTGAAGQIQSIISTGAILKNTDVVNTLRAITINAADYGSTLIEHNSNTHLYGNSSLIFSTGIKASSAKAIATAGAAPATGSYNATTHILAGDRIAKVASVNTSGVTLTQSVKTVTLSTGLSEDEKIDIVGGKLTYANSNTNIITGFTANNVITVRDTHTIGAGQTFTIEYASNTVWGTVISANTTALLYSVGSYYRDSDIDALTVQNFVNDDHIMVYDSKTTKLGAAAAASRVDSHNMHNGVIFQAGNTPAAVTTNTFTIVDAHGASPDIVSICNGALNMTSVNVGAIDTFVLTSGGGGYLTSPIVSVANSYTPTLGNALDVTGAPNALLNINLHSFSTGTIAQNGNVVTLTSDESFPDANSGVLTLTYANGATDQITEVTNSTSIRVTSEKIFGLGTGLSPDKETFSLSYMAIANNITKNSLLYNDDYSARGRVLDFIDKSTSSGSNPYIANGNTTLRVDMTTAQDFGGVTEAILLEEKDFHNDRYSHEKLLLEDFTAGQGPHSGLGSAQGGGGCFLTEDCVTFMAFEDDPGLFQFEKTSASLNSQDNDLRALKFNNDGTKMFMLGRGSDGVYEYSLSTAWDVSTLTFVRELDIGSAVAADSGREIAANGLAFNLDGTKMFVVGQSDDDVNEWALSTGFDLSTASFTDSFDVSSQEIRPYGLTFNNDGTKMYVCGWTGDDVNEYTLTTGFDVSTASYSQRFSTEGTGRSNPSEVNFNADGTYMYTIQGDTNPRIHEYALTTAFDISTASFTEKVFDLTGEETRARGFCFGDNYSKIFVTGWSGDDINAYNVNYGQLGASWGTYICNEQDGSRFYTEATSGERVTAYNGTASAYTTGTMAQSGTTVTGVGTTFPNDMVRGTITYHDDTTSTITGWTNTTSFTVADSKTVGAGNTYSISYNSALTWGINRTVTAAGSGTGNKTVTVTDAGHYLRTGDKVKITGCTTAQVNGVWPITVLTSNTYSYTLPENGAATLAGSIRSMLVSTAWLATSNAVSMDTSQKGNNAVIEVTAIAIGAIQSVEVYDFGAGYSTAPVLSTTSGSQNAELTATLGAYATYPGYYSDTTGLLSGVPKIQDNKYYQNFSYVLKTDFDVNDYRSSVKRLIHPSGLVMFGELAIRSKISVAMFDANTNDVNDKGTIVQDGPDNTGNKYYNLTIYNANTPLMNTRFANTPFWNNEIEIYTAEHPWQTMDARIEIGDEVNIQLEKYAEISSIARTNSTMYVVTETLHGLETGDTIFLTGDESSQQFQAGQTVTSTPTSNTYTITPIADEGTATDQVMYDGYLYIRLEDQAFGNNVILEDGNDLLMEPSFYLKSEVTSVANTSRLDSTNWVDPYRGGILNEDGSDIQLETGGTYLYPSIQFPEGETGVAQIDMSFNSDILLEDDTGYLLDEDSGGMGTGPQRFISLEEDTQGPDHQYESIPIVDTVVGWTNSQTTGWLILQEDESGGILYEDDSNPALGERMLTEYSHVTTSEEGRVKNLRLEVLYVNHESMSLLDRILMESGDVLEMEDNSQIIQEGDPSVLMPDKEVEFDLYESLGWHIKGEDDSYITNEDNTRTILDLFANRSGTKIITPLGSTQPATVLTNDPSTSGGANMGSELLSEYQDYKVGRTFGMQVFRPHYTSQWKSPTTDISFTHDQMTLEGEVGVLLLEDDKLVTNHLLFEDYPAISGDILNSGEAYSEYFRLEDQASGNNILNEEGDSQLLMESSRISPSEYLIHQSWNVLPAYQYSRIQTRLSGQISIPHNSTTVTGVNTTFTTQVAVGEIFQTADENLILEEDDDIRMETDERIQHEDVTVNDVREYQITSQVGTIAIEDFIWYLSKEDSDIAAGVHAATDNLGAILGSYLPLNTADESFWLVGEDTNDELKVGLEDGTGAIEREHVEWETNDIQLEDGSKYLLTDPGEFQIASITNDTTMVVTRKHWGGTDTVIWRQ